MKKNLTPNEWANKIVNGDSFKLIYEDIVETIRLAQKQARHEAIEEVAIMVDGMKDTVASEWVASEIRGLHEKDSSL